MYNEHQCLQCGVWYNNYLGHICVPNQGHCEIFYNYKCPVCFGEFNEPARDGASINSHGNPRCPFCSNPMKGLE